MGRLSWLRRDSRHCVLLLPVGLLLEVDGISSGHRFFLLFCLLYLDLLLLELGDVDIKDIDAEVVLETFYHMGQKL